MVTPSHFRYAGDPMSGVFLVGVAVQYCGYSLAVGLSSDLPMWMIACSRAILSGVMLLLAGWVLMRSAVRISWRSVLLGLVVAGMNMGSFCAAGSLPLGVVSAIEFLGPILLAAVAVRTARGALMIAAGMAGIAVLYLRVGVPQFGDAALGGLLLALLSAGFWVAYILLGHSSDPVADRLPGFGVGLIAGGMVVMVASMTMGQASRWWSIGPATWAQLSGIAAMASVVPYAVDLFCLRVMSPQTFAILTVSLPAVAALLGWLLLGQSIGIWGLIGLALVATSLILLRSGRAGHPMAEAEIVDR